MKSYSTSFDFVKPAESLVKLRYVKKKMWLKELYVLVHCEDYRQTMKYQVPSCLVDNDQDLFNHLDFYPGISSGILTALQVTPLNKGNEVIPSSKPIQLLG